MNKKQINKVDDLQFNSNQLFRTNLFHSIIFTEV